MTLGADVGLQDMTRGQDGRHQKRYRRRPGLKLKPSAQLPSAPLKGSGRVCKDPPFCDRCNGLDHIRICWKPFFFHVPPVFDRLKQRCNTLLFLAVFFSGLGFVRC